VCLLAHDRFTVDGETGDSRSMLGAHEGQAADVCGSILCASSQAEHRALFSREGCWKLVVRGIFSRGTATLLLDSLLNRCTTSGLTKSSHLQPLHLRPCPGLVRSHSWHVMHVSTPSSRLGKGRVVVDVSLAVKTLSFVMTGTTGDSDLLNRSLSSTCTFQKPPKPSPPIPRPIDGCADFGPVDELGCGCS
jgi:hypothetical protein